MRPAEIITLAVSLPLIAALIASEMAAGEAPPPAVRTADARDLAPAMAPANTNEIVVVARRASKG